MDIGFLQFYAFQEYQSIVIPIPVPTSSRACRGILKARCKRAYPPPQLHPRRILDAPAFWVLDVGFWVSSTLCFSRIPIPTSSRACLGILRARYKRAYLAIKTNSNGEINSQLPINRFYCPSRNARLSVSRYLWGACRLFE